jgi:hypothetical protein
MNKESLKSRIAEIEEAIAKVVSNHSVLVGQMNEAKHWLLSLEGAEEASETVKEVEGVIAD